MMCLSPLSLPRPNGRGNTDRITVPCSKCSACLSRKRQEWAFRLEQELKVSNNAYFVTLTYDESNLYINEKGMPSVNKRDVQLFLKRLRKKGNLRYYIVAEYGTKTYRPHYHALIFNFSNDIEFARKEILSAWKKGQIMLGTVTPASINYCAKYCITKPLDVQNRDPVFSLMSRNPGIGYNYVQKMSNWHNADTDRFYAVKPGGQKVSLPRYYREKIYDNSVLEERREKFEKEVFEIVSFDEFKRLNPQGNYYRYVVDVKNDYNRKLKSIINKSSKL